MIDFKVDQHTCTQCKICVTECPVLIIDGKTAFPEIKDGKAGNCLKCQHCLAVCPEGAISIWGKNPENSISTNSAIPKPVELENLMQIRRSIRRYKNDEVPGDLIQHLISMASYAPTGKNENAVQFTVVDNKQDMARLRELTYTAIKQKNESNALPASYAYMLNFSSIWEAKGIDIIFRDAPHLLITSAPKNGTEPMTDCDIAATYFELLTASHGLGTMWDGFAKYVFVDIAPEIKATIGIPDDHEIGTVQLFGKPAVKFARSIQNDNPEIKRISL